ncbi:hypothetical protein Pla123a_06640 [Posidoniimonas polymericola]|uniref:Porin n=1 Tax=Posidoniimonas polymericola TaxID=2528002 RepID=A0A5C5ZFP9_9BACT|nr:outer membrane beta-barrel protein [Posidoniimonas polymericola]TWT85857.1 hypothetical protein Pla123a_06640 [Posidoniimonas polymericola]
MNTAKWTMGVALIALSASPAMAQTAIQTAFNYSGCCEEPSCGCDEPSCCAEPSCGCDDGCGEDCCDPCGCGSTCGGFDCCLLGDCCLGDPCTLSSHVLGDCACWDFGGWTELGYNSNNVRLSQNRGDVLAFGDTPDQLNLNQQWMWFEKVADGSCGLDWGFRFDVMYGTDASKTVAFGNDSARWDTSTGFQHGVYGWAMPQAYLELAAGDFSVIAGHFYTLIGYEVVTAPDNFFFTHSLTMFNSEPFTHTGVLGTYSGIDGVTVYGGWTLGWDTGFDQYNQNGASGSSFLGGFSADLMDDVAFTYICTAGDFGLRSDATTYGGAAGVVDGSAYSHSLVFDVTLSDNLNYVAQSDMVSVRNGVGHDQVGINQYLFYTLNDCVAVGGRMEWWKSDGESYSELTAGINYKAHANVIVRPEVRWDWAASDAGAQALGFADEGDYNSTSFNVDAILTF